MFGFIFCVVIILSWISFSTIFKGSSMQNSDNSSEMRRYGKAIKFKGMD